MKPFQIKGRKGWHAEVRLADGRKTRRSFPTEEAASAWMAAGTPATPKEGPAPEFGGPSNIRLGSLLWEYASRYTLTKGGCEAELTRINHYLKGANLPPLALHVDELGRRALLTKPATAVPEGWKAYLARRQTRSARTFALMHRLGAKLCSEVTSGDIDTLHATMLADGLSPSSVQKEIALLKHLFNVAIKRWNWKGFENPCLDIKLGGSVKRFVTVSEEQMQALLCATAQCDNPLVWPLVELAISSAMRKGSLLALTWSNIDLEGRKARIWGKGRWVDVPLSQRSVEVFRRCPRADTNVVFPMSSNAVDMAWEGIRERAGQPTLQFRDLRHIAPTMYSRKGATATTIMRLLGHTSTRMAQFYIDMNETDVVSEMDRLDAASSQSAPALPPVYDPQGPKKHPRARKASGAKGPTAQEASEHASVAQAAPVERAQQGRVEPGREAASAACSEAQAPEGASNVVYLRRPAQRAA